MIYKTYTVGGILMHHGILGQKHGVRNGPPYPLDENDHNAREKKDGWEKSLGKRGESHHDSIYERYRNKKAYKRAYKDLRKSTRKEMKKDPARPYSRSDEYKKKYTEKLSNDERITKEDLKNLKKDKDAYNKLLMESYKYNIWGSGKGDIKSRQDAEKETERWYEKNDPEQLNKWKKDIKKNGGSLSDYHDFRKTADGFHDELLTKNKAKYDKLNNVSKKDRDFEKKLDDATNRYNENAKKITQKVLGKYGDKIISKDKYLKKTYNDELSDILKRNLDDIYKNKKK